MLLLAGLALPRRHSMPRARLSFPPASASPLHAPSPAASFRLGLDRPLTRPAHLHRRLHPPFRQSSCESRSQEGHGEDGIVEEGAGADFDGGSGGIDSCDGTQSQPRQLDELRGTERVFCRSDVRRSASSSDDSLASSRSRPILQLDTPASLLALLPTFRRLPRRYLSRSHAFLGRTRTRLRRFRA